MMDSSKEDVMPIPLIAMGLVLGGAAVSGAAAGIKGVYDMTEAKRIVRRAEERYGEASDAYRLVEAEIGECVRGYGDYQLQVVTITLGAWVAWLEENERKVRKLDHAVVDGVEIKVPDLPSLKLRVAEAKGILSGATSAVVAAVAAQQAALIGVRALAVAGTGVAISTLSGAAAESATLAWLGGGTIAAGGGGVAAGTVVLSGIAVAPAVLIGGITLAVQGDKARTQAEQHRADVNVAVEEMEANSQVLRRVGDRVGEMTRVVRELDTAATTALGELSDIEFDPAVHASDFQRTALLMRALAEALDTPLIDEDGVLSRASTAIVERYTR